MRVLLLAAGLGTRLRPLTDTVPKCLVEIDGRPLLDFWMELLSLGGVKDILINLHHLPDAVIKYLSRCRYPINITTVCEETLLGTGGTLLRNREFFGGDAAMLIHADNLSCFDVSAFVNCFETRPEGIEITMMTFRTADPRSCGIVEVDEHGIVRAFHEKVFDPPGNLANGAVYIVSAEVFRFLSTLGKSVIDFSTEVLPCYVGRINTFHNGLFHRDIGTPEALLEARKDWPGLHLSSQ